MSIEKVSEVLSDFINAEHVADRPLFSHQEYLALRDKGLRALKEVAQPQASKPESQPEAQPSAAQPAAQKPAARPVAKPRAERLQFKYPKCTVSMNAKREYVATCMDHKDLVATCKTKKEAVDKLNALIDARAKG